ncbi:GAD-like domain-containing protein [Elizabethkingia miricola]|uniref:GAD-like domain-containing protein n=1 Tax=Elizabethkingia miricola TaxID=172045 RepID=UPI0038913DD6
MERLTFEEKNINNYTKQSDVSSDIINKFTDILPNELINIWKTTGFGIYEDGFLQLVNPDEFEFVFNYIDKLLEPSIVFGYTALGDLLIWEGNKNWTISEDEGNRVKIINIRKCQSRALNSMQGTLDVFFDEYFIGHKDYFDSKAFLEIKGKMPKLEYGQCYGYVPALSLGGKASNNNLQIVDVKSYIEVIGQSLGKIIDLG